MQKKSISNNYIAIQGWMVEQLGLKGNELLAYALIHGFSQDGKNQFTGSLTYIQQWLNCAHSTAVLTLQSLVKKQLIKKHEIHHNNQKYCTYQAIIPANITQSQNQTTQSENPTPPVRNSNQTSPKIIHNNIYNIEDNITAPSFDTLWQKYGQKGNHTKSKTKYDELTPDEKKQIWQHLTGDNYHIGYLDATSQQNNKYRKNLENYITSREFEKTLEEIECSNITLIA